MMEKDVPTSSLLGRSWAHKKAEEVTLISDHNRLTELTSIGQKYKYGHKIDILMCELEQKANAMHWPFVPGHTSKYLPIRVVL